MFWNWPLPVQLKYAKVIPVYKGEDETLPENYRPISLSSIYNCLFEKLLYRRLIKFIDKNDTLYDLQYGFRNKHNTQHAILDIVNTIHSNMDNRKYSCAVSFFRESGVYFRNIGCKLMPY